MINKVLLATMSLGIGGAETHIVELALELQRRGYDVAVASNGGVYVADLDKAGIKHHIVPMDRRSLLCMIQSYIKMHKIIKREKPDIVHAHARIPGFICGLLHKNKASSKKRHTFGFVTTAHWVFDVSGSLRYLTNWGQKTLAVSEDIKQYLIDNYGIPARDILVTINAINTEKFSPDTDAQRIMSEFSLDPKRPIICNVSRLDDSAAAATRILIEIAPKLNDIIPGIQILIVGDGDIYEELNIKATAVNATTGMNTVTMTGSRTDVNDVLMAGDLFVGISRAALEAMSAGKPVIMAGKEGYAGLFTPEKLQAGVETNFTFRGQTQTNKEQLLLDIISFFQSTDAQDRIRLGAYCREVILEDYSISKMTDDSIRMYDAASQRRYNVVMSGYYGFRNAGDEAILQSICESISEMCDVSITVLSYDPQDTKSRYGYNAVNRFNILKILSSIRKCDLLVSGGGSLLQDTTSTRSLLYYLFIIRAAKFMRKKVMIYANGIGPVRKNSNRRRVRRVIERADIVTLRDSESADELRVIGVKRDDIKVTADPVFTMNGISRDAALEILKSNKIPETPFVAVSLRQWPGMGDFCEKIAFLCDSIYESFAHEIVFILMQPDIEREICQKVRSLMKHPSFMLEGRFMAEELMGIISVSDMMLAMRLHALIFAACMNVPFVGLVYDPKVSAYLNALSMPSAGDVADFDEHSALAVITDLLNRREEYVDTLKSKTVQLESAAGEDPMILVDLLTKK